MTPTAPGTNEAGRPAEVGMLQLSIVIPIHDEEGAIPGLAEELARVMDSAGLRWEAIWVDDGSKDQSLACLQRLPPPHRHLSLDGNHGQAAAFRAGGEAARAPWLATLDGDGQNDPADLVRLLSLAKERGVDYVSGIRTPRRDHLLRRLSSRIANRIRNWATGIKVQDSGCSSRVLRRELFLRFPFFSNNFYYFPVFTVLFEGTFIEVPVNHRPRHAGKAHYGISNRLWSGIMDLIGVCWLQGGFRKWHVVSKTPDGQG
jgi:dolichol-phosphate mannosyltransferase